MTVMANKDQVKKGVLDFIEKDMIPHATGNYKIVLRGVKAVASIRFEALFDKFAAIPLMALANVVEGDTIDLDLAASVLQEALSNEEFSYTFSLLGDTYSIHIGSGDVGKLKTYIERAQ